MENKMKYAVALIFVLIAFSCFLLGPSAMASEDSTDFDDERPTRWNLLHRPWRVSRPPRWWEHVIRKGTPDTVQGGAVVLEGRILVIEVDGSTLNVIVPKKWVVDGEIMTVEELFDEEGPFEFGDELTIYTLKFEMTKMTHKVTAYFAYRISENSVVADALLPFNIEVTTEIP